MRYWNQCRKPQKRYSLSLWFYLWGIETRFASLVNDSDYMLWFYLWGIETAHFTPLSYNFIACYDSTYEVLKQNRIQETFCPAIMLWFYLWGIETTLPSFPAAGWIQLWFYLWGIETRVIREGFPDGKWLWFYLWGTVFFIVLLSITKQEYPGLPGSQGLVAAGE